MKIEETKKEKAFVTDYSITRIIAGFLRPLSAFVGIALVYLFFPQDNSVLFAVGMLIGAFLSFLVGIYISNLISGKETATESQEE